VLCINRMALHKKVTQNVLNYLTKKCIDSFVVQVFVIVRQNIDQMCTSYTF